jgi:hypothetical protein
MPTYLSRDLARAHVRETHGIDLGETSLENMASKGLGPRYTKIAGRALYTREWLDQWVNDQAERPVVRRSKRRADAANQAAA